MRNRYPGTCRTCAAHVAAGAGVLLREAGRWHAYCTDHAPAAKAPSRGDHSGWHTGELVGYDCETSAPNPRTAFLVSAALVDSAETARTWLVHPGERAIPPEATAIHGITTERARDEGIPAPAALEEITAALHHHLAAGHGLVIFNAPYDLTVLDTELRRHGMATLTERMGGAVQPVIDPLVMDRGIDPYRRGRRNLAAMCEHYGVPFTEAHTAVGDAAACLALAREIGARSPELAQSSLPQLHKQQVEWAMDYARNRQEWLDRTRPGHGTRVDGSWPLPDADD